jgi:circadian clock protein KaiB
MGDVRLCLFVAGGSPRSRHAVEHLQRLRERLGNGVHVEVVDVLVDPAAAEQERIVATPTLVRERPEPRVRLIGDLSDLAAVAAWLDLELDGPVATEVSTP